MMKFASMLPWKWIGVGFAALAMTATIFFAIRAYGNARYDAGVNDTDAKWHAAAEELKRQSESAADGADNAAHAREQAFAARSAEEQEKLNDAITTGDDPFDVLFPRR